MVLLTLTEAFQDDRGARGPAGLGGLQGPGAAGRRGWRADRRACLRTTVAGGYCASIDLLFRGHRSAAQDVQLHAHMRLNTTRTETFIGVVI